MPLTNTEKSIRERERKTRARIKSRAVAARPESKAQQAADAKAEAAKK
jgi:hypothetical protein